MGAGRAGSKGRPDASGRGGSKYDPCRPGRPATQPASSRPAGRPASRPSAGSDPLATPSAFRCIASILATGALLAAQRSGDPERLLRQQSACAEAIRLFVSDYEDDRLSVRGPLRAEAGLRPRYARIALDTGLLSERDPGEVLHLDALNKLLYFAENHPDETLGRAVLDVAAAGLDRSLFDRDALVLRDLGHWALMRMDHQGVWFLCMRVAAGERLPFLGGGDGDDAPDPARRVAALKVLGMKALPVFRSTLEGALGDPDPRVRLAAVEALEFQRRPDALPVLARVMGVERHPVVSQAVVRAVLATLRKAAGELPREQRQIALRAALRMLGQCGWRTDMEIVELVEDHPHKAAIPALIGVLERAALPADQLVELVNRDATPRLRDRAHECLRGMTGAIWPADQPERWRRFWEFEQHNIRVPETLPARRGGGNTRSTFFGIPVTGREIAFVIDTSGSMKEQVGGTVASGSRDERQATRLSLAKEQLLLAVQSMDPAARYHLVTFAGAPRTWSRKAVPPSSRSTRSLTELLSRIEPEGGTNVYEALAQALALDQLRFGEQSEEQIDELFLLSDGEPTAGQVTDPEEILALVAQANKYLKVRINTVFAGKGKGADFLQKLAEQNDGVFVQRH